MACAPHATLHRLTTSGVEQGPHVVLVAHPAAHRERHEHLIGRLADHVEQGAASLVRRGDVEHGDLVGPRFVVPARALDRIPGVAQPHELHPLDDAAPLHVEAGDDSLGEHWSEAYPGLPGS